MDFPNEGAPGGGRIFKASTTLIFNGTDNSESWVTHLQATNFLFQLFDPHVKGALPSDVALLPSTEVGLQSFHFLLHLLVGFGER